MSIQKRTCKANGCTRPIWGKGFCSYHQKLRDDYKEKAMNGGFIKPKPAKKKNRPSYRPFYEYAMSQCTHYCLECGAYISPAWRHSSIAHIVPKSKFPSVATDNWNWLELGVECGCHHRFDQMGSEARKQMRVWPEARRKFELFKDKLLPLELEQLQEDFA